MTERVQEILSWYSHESPGLRANLYKMLMSGRLAGTGKLVILPVDQGFEHGPLRTYLPNPPTFDPLYHPKLAMDIGCNAYAAPLGQLEMAADAFPGQIPLILKANNHENLHKDSDPIPAITATVDDALRLGCAGVGFTIYPGSIERETMYEQLRELIMEVKDAGLVPVVWSYPRGEDLDKPKQTAIDVACYAAQIAAQLGASIIKVKPPTEVIAQEEARKVIEETGTDISTLEKRVALVIRSAFEGKRIVIFSGGAKGDDESVFETIRGIHNGGGFGSIIGRNSFQRSKEDATVLLHKIMDIYAGK